MRLTARGAGTLVLGVVLAGLGLWWRYPGVAALGVTLVLLVVAAVVSVRTSVPIAASRDVRPRTVQRLAGCTGRVELVNPGKRLPVVLDATDHVAGEPVPVDVPLLAPGERTSVEYPIPTDRRGVLSVGPLSLHRRGFAGLAVAKSVLGEVIDVRVVPRVLPVRGLPGGVRRGHVGADERVESGGTDLVGLREYVAGDDLRRLHWATTARTGTLMIREDADPSLPHLAVVLDDDIAAYEDPVSFEDAVEVAASLVGAAVESGHPVRLLTSSGTVDVSVVDEPSLALAALADLGLTDVRRSVGLRDLDVVAVVCGGSSDLPSLLLEVGRAAFGVVLAVAPEEPVSAVGAVLVLRAPKADDLVTAWNTVVAK